jgi:hypothetical protein
MGDEDETDFDDEHVEDEELEDEEFDSDDLQDEDLEGEQRSECPYCSSEGDCAHLLLCFDAEEQSAQGGALLGEFAEKSQAWQAEFERRLPIAMRDFVERLAREVVRESIEGGPGQSFSQELFYCASEAEVKAAIERFTRAKLKITFES